VLLSRLPLRIATALDLHVLGLPPAFALSQDQTLKLDENFSRLITTFDEVRHRSVAWNFTRAKFTRTIGCWPKTSTAEVSSWPFPRKLSPARKAARKDSAVHVSLSSDSLVKQQTLAHSTRDANMAMSMAGCSVTV
jgi:predicted deacetylase